MKITDKIHLLRIDFDITISPERKIPRFVNVILILGDKITLIDTGVKGSEMKIFDYILQNGRDISEIETIILSHSHPDHIGSAATIKEITGCRILAHQAEREWIENIEIQNNERAVPGFFTLVSSSVKIDDYLKNDQIFNLAEGLSVRIIHSPGHSKGSLNLLFIEDKILFTADSIPLKNDIPNYDNYPELMNSLNIIKSDRNYETILTSWTAPLQSRAEIEKVINEGFDYMKRINEAIGECFTDAEKDSRDQSKATLEKLGLPPFLLNPVVIKAFRSHIG